MSLTMLLVLFWDIIIRSCRLWSMNNSKDAVNLNLCLVNSTHSKICLCFEISFFNWTRTRHEYTLQMNEIWTSEIVENLFFLYILHPIIHSLSKNWKLKTNSNLWITFSFSLRHILRIFKNRFEQNSARVCCRA